MEAVHTLTNIMIIDNLDSSIYFSVSVTLLHYITYCNRLPGQPNTVPSPRNGIEVSMVTNTAETRLQIPTINPLL
jgi:hypothetical protein